MENIRVIDIGKKYGNMNKNPRFNPSNFTKEDIKESFDIRREEMGYNYGFNGRLMYMADQKDEEGTFFEITKDYIYSYPEGWSDIKEDILLMKSDIKGVAIGHAVADCPVVMGYDLRKHVVAVGHCSAKLTDKMLPKAIIDSLLYTYDSKEEDIAVYISSGAEKYSYLYNEYPYWAKNSNVWSEMIKEDKYGAYHIDLKGAIKRQLIERNIPEENIITSNIDTVTNPNYYSNRAASLGDKEKEGRNFPCVFFPEQKVLVRKKTR